MKKVCGTIVYRCINQLIEAFHYLSAISTSLFNYQQLFFVLFFCYTLGIMLLQGVLNKEVPLVYCIIMILYAIQNITFS